MSDPAAERSAAPSSRTPDRPVPFADALALATLAGRWPIAAHVLLAIVQGALPLAGLLAMKHLIDVVAAGIGSSSGRAVDPLQQVTFAVLLAAGVAVAGNVLHAVTVVLAETHGRRLADRCTDRLLAHAATVDLANSDRPSYHELLQRASGEAAVLPVRFVQDLAAFASAATAAVVMSVALATVEPWLPALAGIAAVPVAWARRHHATLRFRWHQGSTAQQREVGYLGAVLSGRATAKDVRALRLQPWVQARLGSLRQALRDSLQALARRRARDEWIVHTIAGAALFGVYLHLGRSALAGAMSIGGLVLYAQAAQRTQNAVRDVLSAWNGITEDRLFLRPVVTFAALEPHVVAMPPVATPNLDGAVALEFANVHFAYPEAERPVLEDLTFRIERGERIAIVGPNGSGKSTLVKLALRLYDPTSGSIRIDGSDLRNVAPDRWRARVAGLFQDAASFEATIAENLRFGSERPIDDAALVQALATVGLAERVAALPLGLATPLSRRVPGGVDPSGGELRRLLLARTLVQPASLVVLDEPFAQLDGAIADHVARAITALPRDRTIVLVDHRGLAVRCADRVLLLENGRLVASGTPAAIANEPRFRRLFPDR